MLRCLYLLVVEACWPDCWGIATGRGLFSGCLELFGDRGQDCCWYGLGGLRARVDHRPHVLAPDAAAPFTGVDVAFVTGVDVATSDGDLWWGGGDVGIYLCSDRSVLQMTQIGPSVVGHRPSIMGIRCRWAGFPPRIFGSLAVRRWGVACKCQICVDRTIVRCSFHPFQGMALPMSHPHARQGCT